MQQTIRASDLLILQLPMDQGRCAVTHVAVPLIRYLRRLPSLWTDCAVLDLASVVDRCRRQALVDSGSVDHRLHLTG